MRVAATAIPARGVLLVLVPLAIVPGAGAILWWLSMRGTVGAAAATVTASSSGPQVKSAPVPAMTDQS